jgi:dynein heavy chain
MPTCLYLQTNPMFLDAVAKWQKNLGTVDSVMSTWQDVQKKWQALESIFVGSADIRVQLPEDSKRFDIVNADFQVGDMKGGTVGGDGTGVHKQFVNL